MIKRLLGREKEIRTKLKERSDEQMSVKNWFIDALVDTIDDLVKEVNELKKAYKSNKHPH